MQARMGVPDGADGQAGLVLDCISLRGALSGLSFAADHGALLCVLGGQASGKSALMAVLSGAARPSAGVLSRAGADIGRLPPHRRGFGVVAQHDALFPAWTLAQNVAYPLALRGVPRRDRARMVEAALESVLLDHAGRLPHLATPAERQRAWIARASVFGPQVLLLDEPLAHQPADQRPLLVAALRRLHLLLGTTTIMATRVAGDALAMADQVAVLDRGRLMQTAIPAALYEQPASAVVALASGEANVLPGLVHDIDEDGIARVVLECGPTVDGTAGLTLRPGARCQFCLRPERIAVAPTAASEMGEDALDAVVLEALHLGDVVRLRLLLGAGQEILVKRPAAAGLRGLRPGEMVAIAWQPQHASVFTSQ